MVRSRSRLKEKGSKKSIEELYNAIFAIREALQDATQLAAETATIAEAFGGEISRVITSQINEYFIPAISKYIDDDKTPGAIAPLVTFLDSVPLAMTRQPPEPQQTTPAPIKTELATPPTNETPPAEGSYAAQKESFRYRDRVIREALDGERYNVIRYVDGMHDDIVFTGSKDEAEKKADWLNKTLTDPEIDALRTEYVVKPSKLESQKDVSVSGKLPTVNETSAKRRSATWVQMKLF